VTGDQPEKVSWKQDLRDMIAAIATDANEAKVVVEFVQDLIDEIMQELPIRDDDNDTSDHEVRMRTSPMRRRALAIRPDDASGDDDSDNDDAIGTDDDQNIASDATVDLKTSKSKKQLSQQWASLLVLRYDTIANSRNDTNPTRLSSISLRERSKPKRCDRSMSIKDWKSSSS
jgi:hypothetical protein